MDQPQPIPGPENLRANLDRLEHILATPDAGDPLPALGRMGDPTRLDFLFRLQLAAILRAGPGADLAPNVLLKVAQGATARCAG